MRSGHGLPQRVCRPDDHYMRCSGSNHELMTLEKKEFVFEDVEPLELNTDEKEKH